MLWRTLGIAKSLHQARVNKEMLQMGAPGMQPRSWDRIPQAGIELWGLAGSEDTQDSLPAKRGTASSQGCVPVFVQVAWPWIQLQVPAGEVSVHGKGC